MGQEKKTLSQLAKENPSQLGDPVSMKAETSSTTQTPNNKGAASSSSSSSSASKTVEAIQTTSGAGVMRQGDEGKSSSSSSKGGDAKKGSLGESMQKTLEQNPSALGDPISLKAETSKTEVTENDKGAAGISKAAKEKSKL